MIAHVVLFTPRADLTDADARSFAQMFSVACREISSIRRVRVGRVFAQESSGSSRVGDKTYKVAAYVEFDDVAGLRAYMEHPKHTELAGLFWKYCESTVFVDAEVHDPVVGDIVGLFGLEA